MKTTQLAKNSINALTVALITIVFSAQPLHAADSAFDQGVAALKDGNFDSAIEKFTKAIESNPKASVAYSNRGIAYSQKGNDAKAIEDHTQAIRLNPKNADAYNNRAIAYAHTDANDKAIADINKAIALDPKIEQAWITRGSIFNNLKEYDKAISDFNRAIKINQKLATALKPKLDIALQNKKENNASKPAPKSKYKTVGYFVDNGVVHAVVEDENGKQFEFANGGEMKPYNR